MIVYKQIIGIFLAIILALVVVTISAFVPGKEDKAKYTILSENGKTYYTNTFRIYGKGVIFDDIYNNTIIVQGDLEIKSKKVE